MERDGLIYSRAGSGWYVSEDTSLAVRQVEELARLRTSTYVTGMYAMGKKRPEIIRMVEEAFNE